MLHVHVAQLVAPGAQVPGHRSERFRKRQRRIAPVRASRANELAYQADLRVLVGALKIITRQHLVPELRAAFPGKAALTSDAEAPPRVQQIVDDVARKFGGIGKQAEKMARLASARVLASVDDRLARSVRDSVGVNIEPYLSRDGRIVHKLGEKVIENVNLIETIPSVYFQKIADSVAGNWTGGTRWETLTRIIEEIGDVTDSRARIIARDQTAKLNSAFNQIRQTDIGIEEYEWSISQDERTRGMPGGKYADAESDHYELDGLTFEWAKPGPCKGTVAGEPCHPGEDILCRCDALPYINLDALEQALGIGPPQDEVEN